MASHSEALTGGRRMWSVDRYTRDGPMCGRYALTDPRDIVERFGFMDWSDKRPEPRFNIAPSQEILTIVQLPLQAPEPLTAIWGLKPFWLQKGKAPPINVRVESLAPSAVSRDARRCLIPATG